MKSVSNTMIEWFKNNYFQANPDKFQAIIFDNKSSDQSIMIAGKEVKTTNVVKLLGIFIDDNMNFNNHMSELCKKSW